jgi:hypothetical protein
MTYRHEFQIICLDWQGSSVSAYFKFKHGAEFFMNNFMY